MTTVEELTTPLRHTADRVQFVGKLLDASRASVDLVAPQSATALWPYDAEGSDAAIAPDGSAPYYVQTTATARRQLCTRLGIPYSYFDRLWTDDGNRPLAAENVNHLAARDNRSAIYRMWEAEDGRVLRAVMSDRYEAIDNFTVLSAVTKGLEMTDLALDDCEFSADVTSDRLRMRLAMPSVFRMAEDVLGDYRWPFSHRRDAGPHDPAGQGEIPPILWAGLEITNSETGGGRFTLCPRAVVLVCKNGLTQTKDMLSQVHIGSRQAEGVIDWSDDTRRLSLELLVSQVTDAVRQFCSVEYLDGVLDKMRAAKGLAVDVIKVAPVLQKFSSLSDAETKAAVAAFLRGGDETLLGLGQAVTAIAQGVTEGDRQAELEQEFWRIIDGSNTLALVGAR